VYHEYGVPLAPLHVACAHGWSALVLLLLHHGADPQARLPVIGHPGEIPEPELLMSPAEAATKFGRQEIIEILADPVIPAARRQEFDEQHQLFQERLTAWRAFFEAAQPPPQPLYSHPAAPPVDTPPRAEPCHVGHHPMNIAPLPPH
jgi:hypothetical protein